MLAARKHPAFARKSGRVMLRLSSPGSKDIGSGGQAAPRLNPTSGHSATQQSVASEQAAAGKLPVLYPEQKCRQQSSKDKQALCNKKTYSRSVLNYALAMHRQAPTRPHHSSCLLSLVPIICFGDKIPAIIAGLPSASASRTGDHLLLNKRASHLHLWLGLDQNILSLFQGQIFALCLLGGLLVSESLFQL